MNFFRSISLLFGAVALVNLASAIPGTAGADTNQPTDPALDADADSTPDAGQLMLAKKKKSRKKSKKKRKPRAPEDDFNVAGVTDAPDTDSGVGIHREQEGVDVPYKAEVSLLTDLSFLSSEVEGSEDGAQELTNYSVDIEWLFIFGSFHIGPDFTYRSTSIAVPTTTTDASNNPVTKTVESTTSSYAIGGQFKWNFADINHSDLVPFAYVGVAYRAAETKTGDADAEESSGSVIKAGGGINIFLDSNIAFNPRGEFRRETDTKKVGEEDQTTITMGLRVLVGIGVFI